MTDETRDDGQPMMPGPDGRPAPFEHDWTELDRRRFLKLMGGAAAVTAGAASGLGSVISSARPAAAAPSAAPAATAAAAPVAQRTLVVLDCAGGIDGMSNLVPFSSVYVTKRPLAHVDQSTLLPIDSNVGVHPALAKLHARGLAWVQGVGIPSYDLSHFESLRRWWAADMIDGFPTLPGGFLARVCDAIGDPDAPAVGVTIGFGSTAAFAGSAVATVPCDPRGPFALPIPPVSRSFDTAFANAMEAASLANGSDAAMLAAARKGSHDLLHFLDLLRNLGPAASGYPATTLGAQLALAARILAENAGVKVVHVPVYADFDTHSNHLPRHLSNMTMMTNALDVFLGDIAARGLASSTLVLQYSEFGRRGFDNLSKGLDHGASNAFFIAGPVNAGVYGQYPSFAALDSQGNLPPTVKMSEYYAIAAESWFGIPANTVLTGNPTPPPGIIA